VLQPAITLADEGFAVSPRLAGLLAEHTDRLGRFPATRALFFDGNGDPLDVGDRLRNPDLARTFRLIARHGSDVFYRGEIAADIVEAVRGAPLNPGRIMRADLARYDAPLRAPVSGRYRGYTIYGFPPPTSGGVTVIEMLHLLEHAPRSAGTTPYGATTVHRFAQAARLAFADRGRYLADADWVDVPASGLLSRDYAARRANAVDWDAPLQPTAPGTPPGAPETAATPSRQTEGRSTTHYSVVDTQRNVVAVTASIEQAFGSGMVVPGRGFLLNNQLTDFSARPTDDMGRPVANRAEGGTRPRRTALEHPRAEGGKRPRSSMAPTLVFRDGRPVMALGSPGGPFIIQYVAWTLMQTLAFEQPLQHALSGPIATHYGDTTRIEPTWPRTDSVVAALQALGHTVQVKAQFSGLHGIHIDQAGRLHGGADPRREGVARGY